MKYTSVLFSLLIIFIVGCGADNSVNEIDLSDQFIQEGYVIDVRETEIWVMSDISREEALKSPLDDLLALGNEAMSYELDDTSMYEKGQLLRIGYDSAADSYPGIAEGEINIQMLEENE